MKLVIEKIIKTNYINDKYKYNKNNKYKEIEKEKVK